MKKTYYHAVTMDKLSSIMRSGLIKNVSENGIYFTDDAVSSLDWIRYREELWFKKNHKSIGLVSFEVDTNDENLFEYTDNVTSKEPFYPTQWKDALKSQCVIYKKSIHPSLLKFEECFIDGDDYDCYDKPNTQKYVPPTKKMRIKLMLDRLKWMCTMNIETGEYVVVPKSIYTQINGNLKVAEYVYDRYVDYWKRNPNEIKPFGSTLKLS